MADIDRETIEALRRGEDQAYRAVIDSLIGPVYRFLLRLSRDPSTAEDLAQDTFVAVWQGVGEFEGRSSLKTWVFAIAYRQFLRLRQKHRVETVPADVGDCAEQSPDPCSVAEQTDEGNRIRRLVYGLPFQYREIICLIYLEGLTYKEAADVLETQIGTVKSRANRALKMLRERIGESEVRGHEVRQPGSICE